MENPFVLVRCQKDLYLSREQHAETLRKVLNAFGTRKKDRRFSQLCEVGGTDWYTDKELCGYLEERFADKKAYARLTNKRLDKWLALDEKGKEEMAERLFRPEPTGRIKAINLCCLAVILGILTYLLLR